MNPAYPLLAALALTCCAAPALAATGGMIEAGALQHTLTANFPDWRHQFVRGNFRSDPDNLWDADLVRAKRFGDAGTMLVLGNTHQFNPLWYSNVSIAGSSGGFFLPRFRLDVTGNRKWGAQSQLVTTLGLTAITAKDGHKDASMLLGATYYTPYDLVLEAGVRINRSNPGSVWSDAKYLALTYGRHQQQIVSLRHGFGTEAYQLIGFDRALVDLHSRTTTLTWRLWLRPRQGLQLRAEKYSTAFYRRQGAELALFQEF